MSIRSMLAKANHKIVLNRLIKEASPMGGRGGKETLQPYKVLQPVWIQPAEPEIIQAYGANRIRVTHRIYADQDPETALEDVVQFKDRRMTVRGIINNLELDSLWYIDVED